MKFILKIAVLIIPVLFALAIGASWCPLYFKDEVLEIKAKEREPISTVLPVWKFFRTNGFIKFQIGSEIIYAIDIEAAARKFGKRLKATAVRLLTDDDDGRIFVEVMY